MFARLATLSIALLLGAGCSGRDANTRVVSGRLDTAQVRMNRAQVVAQAANGRVYRAPISSTGMFSITLPINTTYKIRFANSTSSTTRFDSFGTLVTRRPSGTSRWLTVTAGSSIWLGRVGMPGTSSTRTSCGCGEDDKDDDDVAEKDDDDDDDEDDDAEVCDMDGGKDDADMEAEHDPAKVCDSDHDGKADADDDDDDRASCGSKTADDCAHSEDQENDLDDDKEAPCATPPGGSNMPAPPASPTPAPSPGLPQA
jgi:hypothetical protein